LAPKCWLKFGVPVVVSMKVHQLAAAAAGIRKFKLQLRALENLSR
jgi:hypothetical protein